jgi:hypothetical protein
LTIPSCSSLFKLFWFLVFPRFSSLTSLFSSLLDSESPPAEVKQPQFTVQTDPQLLKSAPPARMSNTREVAQLLPLLYLRICSTSSVILRVTATTGRTSPARHVLLRHHRLNLLVSCLA